jgi:hypothetical protein
MFRNVLRVLIVGVLLPTLSCARDASDSTAFRFPWQETPDRIPGVKTPQERINELKAMAISPVNVATAEQLALEIQREQDPQVRCHIVLALAKAPDAKAAAVLHAGLEDPEESVRIACCEAWGRRGGPEAVQELSSVLQGESNIDVRMAAAKALGETKQAEAVKPLADVLADNDPAIQRRAMESLKNVSGKDYGYNVQSWRQYASGGPQVPKERSVAERLFGRTLF